MKARGLGIDLTHRCNLKCSFCWKFVETSQYEMTINQVEKFCYHFGYLKPQKLRVTGGEPLEHPQFKEIIPILLNTFPQIQLTTNGLLLDDTMFYERVRYVVTPYPANKEVGERFGNKVIIYPRPHGYYNRYHDPDLPEKTARKKHETCLYKQIRVIGDNVYDCCHAQTMERLGKCPPVHAKVEENWEHEFVNSDWWQECVHCFVGDGGEKLK